MLKTSASRIKSSTHHHSSTIINKKRQKRSNIYYQIIILSLVIGFILQQILLINLYGNTSKLEEEQQQQRIHQQQQHQQKYEHENELILNFSAFEEEAEEEIVEDDDDAYKEIQSSLDNSTNIQIRTEIQNINKEQTAAICALMKGEESYVDEWVDYNLALGFSHVYIYDNSLEFYLKNWSLQKPNTTVIHLPGRAKQPMAQKHCLTSYTNLHTWMALFDGDEFLVLKKHTNVVQMLKEHCTQGSLAINWYIFGPSHQITYQPRPVLQRFQYRHYRLNNNIKVIVKLSDYLRYKANPHSVSLVAGTFQHDTNNNTKFSYKGASSQNKPYPNDVAVLHHYRTKSRQEWSYKGCIRKRQAGTNQLCLEELSDDEFPIFDDSAWKFLVQNVPLYKSINNSLYNHYHQHNIKNIAICSLLTHNYEFQLLEEWLDYHLYLHPIQHIYIYDSTNRLQHWRYYYQYHYNITIKPWMRPQDSKQQKMFYHYFYFDCLSNFGKFHDFLGYFNLNEFLFTTQDINKILSNTIEPILELNIHNMICGNSNEQQQQQQQQSANLSFPITKQCTKRIVVTEDNNSTQSHIQNQKQQKKSILILNSQYLEKELKNVITQFLNLVFFSQPFAVLEQIDRKSFDSHDIVLYSFDLKRHTQATDSFVEDDTVWKYIFKFLPKFRVRFGYD